MAPTCRQDRRTRTRRMSPPLPCSIIHIINSSLSCSRVRHIMLLHLTLIMDIRMVSRRPSLPLVRSVMECSLACRFLVSPKFQGEKMSINHLIAMIPNPSPQHTYAPPNQTQQQGYPQTQQPFDTTGQIAPPGMKPRVTATLWEDEGSLCFQVEAKGVCVARREGRCIV